MNPELIEEVCQQKDIKLQDNSILRRVMIVIGTHGGERDGLHRISVEGEVADWVKTINDHLEEHHSAKHEVNVAAPEVTVEAAAAPSVTVNQPAVNVAAPAVEVAAPNVTVPTTVNVPEIKVPNATVVVRTHPTQRPGTLSEVLTIQRAGNTDIKVRRNTSKTDTTAVDKVLGHAESITFDERDVKDLNIRIVGDGSQGQGDGSGPGEVIVENGFPGRNVVLKGVVKTQDGDVTTSVTLAPGARETLTADDIKGTWTFAAEVA